MKVRWRCFQVYEASEVLRHKANIENALDGSIPGRDEELITLFLIKALSKGKNAIKNEKDPSISVLR